MPRNLLALPPKSSTLTSSSSRGLGKALASHIREHFTDTHPDAFAKDLNAIARMRDEVARMEPHVATLDAAIRYHAQLVFLATKFPAAINLAFPWTVAFPPALPLFPMTSSSPSPSPPGSPGPSASSPPARSSLRHDAAGRTIVAHPDLNYERAAVLFALAALYSTLGAGEARGDGESIKRAVAMFQNAAGVLDHILTSLRPALGPLYAATPRTADPDLTSPTLSALRDLMLAQAQECVWQKAVMDRLKDATIAKLAARVGELYASALEHAASASSGEAGSDKTCELPRDWISHMTVKRWHFAAAAQYRKACDDLGANRYGDEIGRLQAAEAATKKALEAASKRVAEAILNDLRSLQGIIATDLRRATKDNDLIYLEPVTPEARLPPIQSAAMAKATVPPEVANPIPQLRQGALGAPLFQELVPYGVHLALSIYEDRKDTMLREEFAARRDELDAVAASTLQSLNLPGALQALEQPLGLPSTLMRKSDDVRLGGGLERLHGLAEDVGRMAQSDAAILSEAIAMLDDEEREDAEMRSRFSEKTWAREGSEEAAAMWRAKAQEYADTLEQARRSDAVVRTKMEDWEDAIGVLAEGKSALEAFVPSGAPTSSTSAAQNQAARALRAELERLDDVLDARASLVSEVRAQASNDDVRPAVLREAGLIAAGKASGGGEASVAGRPLVIQAAHFEPLFDGEMAKYARARDEMERSAKAQEELLDVIRQRNDAFVEARKVDTTVKRREKALQTLDMAFSKWRELNSNFSEGNKFYNQFARLLTDFRQQVKEWRYARQTDVLHLTQRFAGTSLNSPQPQAQGAPTSALVHAAGGVRTRAQARASAGDPQRQGAPAQPPQQQQHQQPQWGGWQGGSIQFGD